MIQTTIPTQAIATSRIIRSPIMLLRLSLALVLPASILLSSLPPTTSSASSSPSQNKQLEKLDLPGIRPDPFVAASPLIVAAVCKDGVAMVASHVTSSKERLLRDIIRPEDDAANDNQKSSAAIFQDLPELYGGPFRIHTIDRYGTHLLAAGWRADCDLFTAKLRSIASREKAVFGPPTPKWGLPYYARHLAQEASYWMAQCAVSEAMRPLSCAGLLVGCANDQNTGIKNDGEESFVGSLWFVDMSGAHRARALAIGGGKVEGSNSDSSSNNMVAQLVNLQLQYTDFTSLTAEEGLQCLVQILKGQKKPSSMENIGDSTTTPLLPGDCELEMAICTAKQSGLQRRRLSEFVGTTVR